MNADIAERKSERVREMVDNQKNYRPHLHGGGEGREECMAFAMYYDMFIYET